MKKELFILFVLSVWHATGCSPGYEDESTLESDESKKGGARDAMAESCVKDKDGRKNGWCRINIMGCESPLCNCKQGMCECAKVKCTAATKKEWPKECSGDAAQNLLHGPNCNLKFHRQPGCHNYKYYCCHCNHGSCWCPSCSCKVDLGLDILTTTRIPRSDWTKGFCDRRFLECNDTSFTKKNLNKWRHRATCVDNGPRPATVCDLMVAKCKNPASKVTECTPLPTTTRYTWTRSSEGTLGTHADDRW